MEKRQAARSILFMKNGEGKNCIALIHRIKHGCPEYYVTPGGGIEGAETPEEAVKRELMEELGVQCEPLKRLATVEEPDNIHHYFLCDYTSGKFGTGTGPEYTDGRNILVNGTCEPTLVPLDKLNSINLVPKYLYDMIEKLEVHP